MITMFGLVERTVPTARLGEAMAALVSAIILAQSAGTFLGGWAADHLAPDAPFRITVVAAAAALLLAASTATDRRYPRRGTGAANAAAPAGDARSASDAGPAGDAGPVPGAAPMSKAAPSRGADSAQDMEPTRTRREENEEPMRPSRA